MIYKNSFNRGKILLIIALSFAFITNANAKHSLMVRFLALRIQEVQDLSLDLCLQAWNNGFNAHKSGIIFSSGNTPYLGPSIVVTEDDFSKDELENIPQLMLNVQFIYMSLRDLAILDLKNPNTWDETIQYLVYVLSSKFGIQISTTSCKDELDKESLAKLETAIENCGEKELIILAEYLNRIVKKYFETPRFNMIASEFNSNLTDLSQAIYRKLPVEEHMRVNENITFLGRILSERNIRAIMELVIHTHDKLQEKEYPLALTD